SADHRYARGAIAVALGKCASFDDWDAHCSEVVHAGLLTSDNPLLPRQRSGTPLNLKLGRIPVVIPREKADGADRLNAGQDRESLLRLAVKNRDLAPISVARRRQRRAQRQHVVWIKALVLLIYQSRKPLNCQPGPDQQRERQRDFGDD